MPLQWNTKVLLVKIETTYGTDAAPTGAANAFRAWATALLHASYQRRKSAGRTSATGCSFWPTPTHIMGGNRVSIRIRDGKLDLTLDRNQSGRTQGLKYAAISWTLAWELMAATGWTPGPLVSSPRVLVTLLPGDAHSTVGLALQLNPAFTDWMMGWPSGWTDPLQPVTGWSRWLRHGPGAC